MARGQVALSKQVVAVRAATRLIRKIDILQAELLLRVLIHEARAWKAVGRAATSCVRVTDLDWIRTGWLTDLVLPFFIPEVANEVCCDPDRCRILEEVGVVGKDRGLELAASQSEFGLQQHRISWYKISARVERPDFGSNSRLAVHWKVGSERVANAAQHCCFSLQILACHWVSSWMAVWFNGWARTEHVTSWSTKERQTIRKNNGMANERAVTGKTQTPLQ